MIVAGADYRIFLMMRYRELEVQRSSSIIEAAKHIGGVVLSVALILGGTFAALIPSGIVTLMQVAIFVLVGLVLLSFIVLPMFMPAVMGNPSKRVLNKIKESKILAILHYMGSLFLLNVPIAFGVFQTYAIIIAIPKTNVAK